MKPIEPLTASFLFLSETGLYQGVVKTQDTPPSVGNIEKSLGMWKLKCYLIDSGGKGPQ